MGASARSGLMEPVPHVELSGHALDLGRPELEPLMERYRSAPVDRSSLLVMPPTALVVGWSDVDEVPLTETLENDGWAVRHCEGPGAGSCPVMHGKPCPLRRSVDAAIVFADLRGSDRYLGALPRLRCAADSASPGLVALVGRHDRPTFSGSVATVGGARDPRSISNTLTELIETAY